MHVCYHELKRDIDFVYIELVGGILGGTRIKVDSKDGKISRQTIQLVLVKFYEQSLTKKR